MTRFYLACCLTACVCLVLFGIFLIAPGAYVAGYGVPSDIGTAFLGNRVSPMFLGLSTLCWLMRNQQAKDICSVIAVSMIVTFVGIAATGIWSFLDGTSSGMILLAALGECVIASMFIWSLRDAS